jgi:hydroxymethylbilane synthase
LKKLALGTRGSALALVQARLVKRLIEEKHPGLAVEIVPIKTTGDKLQETPLAPALGKGVFIKEIQEALLDGRVDLAVHSMKDLPTDATPGLAVAAVLEREDPRDCLISRFGEQLLELPRGALVGTGSPRRQAQVRAAKKGVGVVDMRGNLDTRLRKLQEGELTSIVVALAGVRRLGRQDEVSEVLSPELMLPAPSQGCIAVETRAEGPARGLVAALNHAPSERAAAAERAFLAGLGGGCRTPIAAYAREEKGAFILDGLVISLDGAKAVRGRESGTAEKAEEMGRALSRRLLDQGAAGLLGFPSPLGRGQGEGNVS